MDIRNNPETVYPALFLLSGLSAGALDKSRSQVMALTDVADGEVTLSDLAGVAVGI